MFNIAKPSPQEFLEANPDLPSDVKQLVRDRPDLAHALLFDGVPYQKGDSVYTTKGGAISVTRSVPPSPARASSEIRESTSPVVRAAPPPAPVPAPASRAVPAAPAVDASAEIANIGFQRAGLPVPASRAEPPATAVRHIDDHDPSAELASLATRRICGDDGIQSSIDALFPDPPNAA